MTEFPFFRKPQKNARKSHFPKNEEFRHSVILKIYELEDWKMSKILTHVKIADQSMCPFLGTTCRYWHCMAWRSETEGASGYCALIEKEEEDDDVLY